ncbi:anthrax toxin lethal factor-related metalloendopeptidase [Radiobacillus sp. PE A8.2]|uniref:anthrax toxin lethal factor-related metalloendopeptidase n=1 Tax=Radiobacillus sp. PE A8.2 TaxID=3380349 RepID=UPI00388D7778
MIIGKRLLVLVIVFIFFILPHIQITKPLNGIMLQRALGQEDLGHLQNLNNSDLLAQLIVMPDQLTNRTELIKMVERINRIDRPILQLLVNQKVKVRLFEGKLTDEPLLYYLRWDKPRGWKSDVTWADVPGSGGGWLISAKIGASMPGSGHGSINLELHEIGHTVYKLLMTSPNYALAIQEMWNTEVNNMFDGKAYFIDYPSEYFSEMFAYYYFTNQSNQEMMEKAPKTYQFFNSLKLLKRQKIENNFYSMDWKGRSIWLQGNKPI